MSVYRFIQMFNIYQMHSSSYLGQDIQIEQNDVGVFVCVQVQPKLLGSRCFWLNTDKLDDASDACITNKTLPFLFVSIFY